MCRISLNTPNLFKTHEANDNKAPLAAIPQFFIPPMARLEFSCFLGLNDSHLLLAPRSFVLSCRAVLSIYYLLNQCSVPYMRLEITFRSHISVHFGLVFNPPRVLSIKLKKPREQYLCLGERSASELRLPAYVGFFLSSDANSSMEVKRRGSDIAIRLRPLLGNGDSYSAL